MKRGGGERVKNITLYLNISTVAFLETVYNWNCYKKWTPQDDCKSLERSLLPSGGKHMCALVQEFTNWKPFGPAWPVLSSGASN